MRTGISLPLLLLLVSFSGCLTDSDPDLTFEDSLQGPQPSDSNSIDPLSIPNSDRHKKRAHQQSPFRTSALIDDDEDRLSGYNSGSGPDIEGSGEHDDGEQVTISRTDTVAPSPTRPPTIPTIPPVTVPGKALYFRVTMTLLSIPYEPALSDRNSPAFKRLSDDLVLSLEPLFERLPGQQIVQPISFSPTANRLLMVTFDIGSRHNNDEPAIREVVERMVNSGYAGRHRVTRDAFTFRRYGTSPVKECESHEFSCGPDECIDVRRVCDKRRDCRDGSDERQL